MFDAKESPSLTALALEISNNELSHLDILSEWEPKSIGALEAIKITQRRGEHRPFRHCLAKKRFVMCVAHRIAHPHRSQQSTAFYAMHATGRIICIMQNANCALVRYSHSIELAMWLWAVGKRCQN